jgi:hypothetical protein
MGASGGQSLHAILLFKQNLIKNEQILHMEKVGYGQILNCEQISNLNKN